MTDNPANYTFESLPLDGLQQQDELDIGAELGIDANDTNYRIPVYQHGPKGLAWLFDYTLSDQVPLLERLRDEYGGGQYEVRAPARWQSLTESDHVDQYSWVPPRRGR
jgi:hypothetical protein